jgi:putative tryptophan/tyrosine transport system substrate-binding protein
MLMLWLGASGMQSSQLKRRAFVTLLGGAAAWPLAARAQQPQFRKLGVLFATDQNDPETPARLAAMKDELLRDRWVEGNNLHIDVRYGGGDTKHIRDEAATLVASRPDVLLVLGTVVAKAVQQTQHGIPVVFVQVSDPVEAGFASSLSRPGGNITGFTTYEYSMAGKWLEMLKEIAPNVRRVLLLLNPENVAQWEGYKRSVETFAPTMGISSMPGPVRNAGEIERTISVFANEPNGGILVPPDAITTVHRRLIVETAARLRVAAIYPYRLWPLGGGLVSYGIDVVDQFRRATSYVNRILAGEKPGDLPIQAPTQFQTIINLRTAKALGLDIPATLLARADEVIE